MRLDNRRTPRRISLGVARALIVAGAASAMASCSVIYDLGADQCNEDADCAVLGGVFANKVCQQNVCVDPGGCQTNADCMGELANEFGGVQGEPSICRERVCIPLRTTECPQVLPIGDGGLAQRLLTSSENPVVLGGFAEIPTGSGLGTGIRNYDLALTELSSGYGGLPGSAGAVRPVVMVVCQGDTEDNAVLDAAMDHLADDLKVPAVVSSLSSANLQHVFSYKGQSAGMFFMSTQDADSVLTQLPDDNLIWSMLPGGKALGVSYAPLLTRALTFLDLPDGEQARVAVAVAQDVRLLSDMALTATDTPANGGIVFNDGAVGDGSVSDNLDNGTFLQIPVPASQAQIDAVVALRPHVVLAPATGAFLSDVVPLIEAGWPTDAGAPPKPFYVLSPYHYNSARLQDLINTIPAVRTRLVGLNAAAAADDTLYRQYRQAFQAYDLDNWEEGWENYYDAMYYTFYAGARASTTGQDFAQGMGALLSGSVSKNVGARDLSEGLGLVNSRVSITLIGTLGAPNFDPLTGARQGPASVWCVEQGPTYLPDVLRYEAGTTPAMAGTMPPTCIPGGF